MTHISELSGEDPVTVDLPDNQILCGDAAHMLKTVEDKSVDLVVTDPPYLVNYKDRYGRKVANDDNADGVLPVFDEVYRTLKDHSYCISFYGWNSVHQFTQKWTELGFRIVGHIVWAKDYASRTGFTAYCHESAFILAKGRPRQPAAPIRDVQPWHYTGNSAHPTEKAVEIIAPLIKCFSNTGDLVLDPFMGAGATPVAASLNGRRYIGVELEERYCEIARKRLTGCANYKRKLCA